MEAGNNFEQLKKSLDLLTAVVETVPNALVVLNAGFRVERANSASLELFGLSHEDIQGRHVRDLPGGEWATEEMMRFLMDAASGKQCFLEIHREFPALGDRTLRITARRIQGSVPQIPSIRGREYSPSSRTHKGETGGGPAGPSRIPTAEDEEAGDYSRPQSTGFAGQSLGEGPPDRVLLLAMEDVTVKRRTEEALRMSHESLERKIAERTAALERSNAELEQFAYVCSHDLKEPLRMVSSYTGLLEKHYRERLDGQAREYIDFARDAAARMYQLIDGLMALSRVAQGPSKPEPVRMDVVLAAAEKNLQLSLRESGARIIHEHLPTVLGEKTQLIQLFQNLIGNAIKFRRGEAPIIRIEWRERDSDILFSVSDDGIGIEGQYLDRIFVIFQRLHRREEYPGTGIGLAICKKIVERHGGRIWAESEPGKGSIFYFTIPKRCAMVP